MNTVMNNDDRMSIKAAQLAEGVSAVIEEGLIILEASSPAIHIRPSPLCLRAVASGYADYTVYGNDLDMSYRRVGCLCLGGCLVWWEENGQAEINQANRKIEEIRNAIHRTV